MNRILCALLLALAFALHPVDGRAAAPAPNGEPSPRAVLSVGGVSVVLIAAKGQLHAFLDRTVDNAPVAGGKVRIRLAKAELVLEEVSPGVYVAPFQPQASGRHALTVEIDTAAGKGQGGTELMLSAAQMKGDGRGKGRFGWIAGVLLAGAAAGGGWWWLRRGRRVAAAGAA